MLRIIDLTGHTIEERFVKGGEKPQQEVFVLSNLTARIILVSLHSGRKFTTKQVVIQQ